LILTFRIVDIVVKWPPPTFAETDDLMAFVNRSPNQRFHTRVESGDITPTSKYSYSHDIFPLLCIKKIFCNNSERFSSQYYLHFIFFLKQIFGDKICIQSLSIYRD